MLDCSTSIDPSASLQAEATSAFSETQWLVILSGRTLENIPMDMLKQSFVEGLPASLRGRIWSFVTKSASFSNSFSRRAFEVAVTKAGVHDSAMIKKDISRTLPNLLKTPELLLSLERILCAYAGCDPEVGYCQGMGFIAAAILVVQGDEYVAFSTFYQVMRDKNWREVYSNGTPGLMKLLTLTYSRIAKSLSTLYAHISRVSLDGCISQFYLTAFLSTLQWEDSLRVLDMFLLRGADCLVDLLVRLLQLNQHELLHMNDEELYDCLRSNLATTSFSRFPATTLLTPLTKADELEDYVIF